MPDFRSCSCSGCERNAHSGAKGVGGLCSMHWRRLKRHGDPTKGRTPNGTPLQWLLDHRDYHEAGCLIWPFAKNPNGYGWLRYGERSVVASNLMCRMFNGEPPTPEHETAHSCGKGHEGCIHPLHLSWKTRAGNCDDKIIHDTLLFGEKHPSSVLNEEQVRVIRHLKGKLPLRKIAAMYGVTLGAISGIVYRKTWAHLP